MLKLNRYRAAIFDCDGVILNSNSIKSEAFALALPDEPKELVSKFVKYHQENGGVSRYIKFDYYFKNIRKLENYKELLEVALTRYAQLSRKGLLECEELEGIRPLLRKFNDLNVPCYVTSGGDQEEVREVLLARGLYGFFNGVFGSPNSKVENLTQLNQKALLNLPGIYFGDAKSDMLAANEFNLDFVYVSGVSEWTEGEEISRRLGHDTILNFNGLLRE